MLEKAPQKITDRSSLASAAPAAQCSTYPIWRLHCIGAYLTRASRHWRPKAAAA